MQKVLFTEEIGALPLFSGLSKQEIEALLNQGSLRYYERKEALFFHGDAVTYFYIILRGTLQLYRGTSDGKEKTIELLKAGQTVGEGEIMDKCCTHRMNAVAVEEAAVMLFPASWLKETAKQHSAFALNLLSSIAHQMHMAVLEAEHQATLSAAQLVACFLQRLCVLYGFDPHGFELPYSKTLIASRLGMELETLSRTLAKLRKEGIVVSGTHVAIKNLLRIEHYVCQFCSISRECGTHQAIEKKMGTDKTYL
jgi:CRP-like cAMP-binding protein